MATDWEWDFEYDAADRLSSVAPTFPEDASLRVLNEYDYRGRRIRKIVQQLAISQTPPPPSPPIETRVWNTVETHTFVWDENNIVLEKIVSADGTIRTCEYFWGLDKSGTEQGAGGVGGLFAVSIAGVFYIPCYDHNGNIVRYISESGVSAAQYVYDPYGSTIEQSGEFADVFSFGFSTKYHDRELGMIGYQQRFYRPDLGRWLNRDPIEEEGGVNMYAFCQNNPVCTCDKNGCAYFAYRPLDSFLFRWFVLGNEQDDFDNTMLAHEQLFFEDGGIPTNLGFFDDNEVRIDTAGISYRPSHSTGWDDCIMRKAVQMVKPRK
jgi:RHS repeat-associated protein